MKHCQTPILLLLSMINYWRIASNQEKREQLSDRSQNQQEILSPLLIPMTFSLQNTVNKKSSAALVFLKVIFCYDSDFFIKIATYRIWNELIFLLMNSDSLVWKNAVQPNFLAGPFYSYLGSSWTGQNKKKCPRKRCTKVNATHAIPKNSQTKPTLEKLRHLFLTYFSLSSCERLMRISQHWTFRYQPHSVSIRHERAKPQSQCICRPIPRLSPCPKLKVALCQSCSSPA